MNPQDALTHLPVNLVNYGVGTLVLIWIIREQVRRKPVNQKRVLGIVLSVIGLLETLSFIQHTPVKALDLGLTVLSLVVGSVLAVIRAHTIRIWSEGYGGQRVVLQQGNWLTALLWIVGIGQHLVLDAVATPELGSSTLLLYFGLIIVAQRRIVLMRATARHLIP
ncbi:MAG: hypothetical protein JWQ81_8171 [Amycolatopsis sp.]|jgi:hypothetical protein|uniref:hypothetical protein n=1 Tax=Amycolatopsis sp. TaxID=37632 RepID=UPI00260FFCBF|nr:hypothetical protein [Amycolatopsis sp.]MCU1687432.1 hypothetical protein [Amycolatopsis sp.]